ncbi:MAG TPA: hypothetical protein O0Y02_00780 [Methanocorpusculum sp.]|nr:hypothetical protein [Methanocorpusculum sp.]
MSDHFHAELASYKDEVIWYGRFALDVLKHSVSAFEAGDTRVASDIVRQKSYVSSQYEHLYGKGILLIALNQPMAADLRLISCAMDVVTSSERIGRYGKDIAELVSAETEKYFLPEKLYEMGELTGKNLEHIYNVFASDDLSLLKECASIEDTVDRLYHEVYAELVEQIEEKTVSVAYGSACLMMNRYLERCSDHACRMGEKMYYMQTGKHLPLAEIE